MADIITIGLTIAINIISVIGQHLLSERNRKAVSKQSQLRDIRQASRRIKRTATAIDPMIEVDMASLEVIEGEDRHFEDLVNSMEELEEQYDELSNEMARSEVGREMSDLISWYDNPSGQSEPIRGREVTTKVVEEAAEIRQAAEKRIDSY